MAGALDPDSKLLDTNKTNRKLFLEFFWANLANLFVLTGSVMFVLLPEYLQTNGMNRSEIGLIDGSFWLISVFVQPWLGLRLDKDGRKIYLVIGSLLMAAAAFSYHYTPIVVAPMLVPRIIHGFGFACYLTSSWAWVADMAPPKRLAEFFGIFGIGGMLAGATGPGLAKHIVIAQGYAGLFFWGSLTILTGALMLLFLSNRKSHLKAQSKKSGFFRILVSNRMRGPAIGSLAFGLAVGCLFAFIAPYLASLKIDGVGSIFAATALASGASRVYAGRQNHLGPARMIMPSLICLAVGCAGLALVSFLKPYSLILLITSGLAAGLGYGIIYPALNAVAIERLSPASRGQGLSLITASIDSGSFIGAVAAGEVMHRAGYPTGFFFIAVLLLTLATVFSRIERKFKFRQPNVNLSQSFNISKGKLD